MDRCLADNMSVQTTQRRQADLPGGRSGSEPLGFTPLIRRVFWYALDLLYPPRCGGCGVAGEGLWCPRCLEITRRFCSPDWFHTPPLTVDTPTGSQMILAVSAAPFIEPLRQGIHEFKYNGTPDLAQPFAGFMSAAWEGAASAAEISADLIVPVPLHPKRLRERGFNQSEHLGYHVGRETGIPMAPRALSRTRHTEHQARLGAAERKQNVQGAFAADAVLCAGKHVLLIDDVLTTGTTLCECAMALLAAGAARVSALTLARASD